MRPFHRVIAVLLMPCLLAFLLPLSACGRKEEATESPSSSSTAASDHAGQNPSEDGFTGGEPPLTPGPEDFVTSWAGEVEMPFINPYGKEERYAFVAYEADAEVPFPHIDENGRMTETLLGGESWDLDVDGVGSLSDFVRRMATHAMVKQLEPLIQAEDDQWMARGIDGSGAIWWAQAEYSHDTCHLTVVRERRLDTAQPLVIWTDAFPDGVAHFTLHHAGTDFLSLKAEFPQGGIDLSGNIRSGYDCYDREVSFRANVWEEQGTMFLFDGLPQDPGLQSWSVTWQEPMPDTVTLTLYASAPLREVAIRETLGAIRVRNAAFGNVRVKPYLENETWVAHPEYAESALSGDVTPDGDVVFWLPPGYWDVLVTPPQEWLGTCRTCLIPVRSGQETVVTMPGSLMAAYAPRSENPEDDRGMEILSAMDSGDRAEIVFTLSDRTTQAIPPTPENTTVLEGGTAGRVLSVERVKTPPHVVLLLDSSGSMKGQMDKTLQAARAFVGGLPDDAAITVVDFDTEPRVLKGTTKAEALTGLGNVKANGATALYDSVQTGLALLADKDRPTLILFTDGMDANLDDSGPGSAATREEVLAAVAEAGIPLYTIGFGPRHDVATLDALARQSEGRYYPADDQQALAGVFAAIAAKLGNTYRAVYERPKTDTAGDTPVVSMVLDSSGSMDMDPEMEGGGYRLHRVKTLFHQFILDLPTDMLAQITAFDDAVSVTQTLTTNKAELLAGLDLVDADGGTNISSAVDATYETLKAIPSTRKAIVFLTDAALDVPDKDAFHRLLGRIREDGILMLWAGVGLEEEEAVFAEAAELSGGAYVLTEDPDTLRQALDALMDRMERLPPSKETSLRVMVGKRTETGELFSYSAGALAAFSPQPSATGKREPETVQVAYGERFSQYEPETAALVYGTDVPSAEVKVVKRIPLGVKGQNEAMAWEIHEELVLGALRGLEAPSGMRFLGLHATFTNVMPVQEVIVYPDGSGHPSAWLSGGASQGIKKKTRIPYLLPDLSAHIFLQINNAGQTPVSPITWLAETPMVVPGDMSLLVQPDQPVEGMLIFLVPDEAVTQLSLHLYDTDYGHIATPLTGVMTRQDTSPAKLPKTVENRLSDAFSLSVDAYAGMAAVSDVAAGEGTTFRVVEGRLTSRVQALLELDPAERFRLRIQTDKGDFWLPNHPVTDLLPYGFRQPAVLAPGSRNTFRMAFQVPDMINGLPAQLVTDVKSSTVVTPLAGTAKAMTVPTNALAGDGWRLVVNGLYAAERVAGDGGNWIVADLTAFDLADGSATAGLAGLLYLESEPGVSGDGEAAATAVAEDGEDDASSAAEDEADVPPVDRVEASGMTGEMLLGFGEDAVVPDGMQRRGFVAFLPENPDAVFRLRSEAFPGLDVPVSGNVLDEAWTVPVTRAETQDDWQLACTRALGEAVAAWEGRQAAEAASAGMSDVDMWGDIPSGELKGEKAQAARIPVPAMTVYGQTLLEQVADVGSLFSLLHGLRWIPDGRTWESGYAPEAVLTQGWGTEGDLMRVAEQGLSKLGFSPRRRTVSVTDAGRRGLENKSSLPDALGTYQLPALSWLDADGKERLLVIPFMKDITELGGMCWLPAGAGFAERREDPRCVIRVFAEAISQSVTVGSQFGSMADALGGSSDGERAPEEVLLLEKTLPLPLLSRDALDLGFTEVGQGKGPVVTAWLGGVPGTLPGQAPIDTGLWKVVGFRTEIVPPDGSEISHRHALAEGESLQDVFVCYGLRLPELPETAADGLEKASVQARAQTGEADDLSALRWYGRSLLNRYVAGQTRYETETASRLGLVTGRTRTTRAIAVTVQRTTGKVRTGIDLLRHGTDIHNADAGGDLMLAAQAFRSATGFMATTLEAEVLPGDGLGLFDLWAKLPRGTSYVILSPDAREDAETDCSAVGMPEAVIARLLGAPEDVWVLVPDKPARVGGRDRWAWLEMKADGETVGVLDTGAHGGMVEVSIQDWVNEANMYIVGGLVGVTASLWTVSAFSLELDDYAEILKRAEAAALGVQQAFGFNAGPAGYGVGGLPEISGSSHGIKASLGTGGITLSQDILGFGNGYAAGVAYYFAHAK